MSTHREIHVAAGLLIGSDGRALLVRKRGTSVFLQPGGKIEPGEDPLVALARELDEELALRFAPETARYMGRFMAPAANEADATVIAEVYLLRVDGDYAPQAEIEEARWVDPAAPGDLPMAALTSEMILPAYRLMTT